MSELLLSNKIFDDAVKVINSVLFLVSFFSFFSTDQVIVAAAVVVTVVVVVVVFSVELLIFLNYLCPNKVLWIFENQKF